MGLAASQARLLSLTARIHDVEYQAQMIQSSKLQLALKEDEVYRRYNDALDAQTLTYQDMQGNRIAATFNNLCGLGSISNNLAGSQSYIFRDKEDKLIIPADIYENYVAFAGEGSNADPYQFAMYMMYGDKDADYSGAISEYLSTDSETTINGSSTKYESIRKEIDTLLDSVWTSSNAYKSLSNPTDEDKSNWKKNIITELLNESSIDESEFSIKGDNGEVISEPSETVKEVLKKLTSKADSFKHKVVRDHGEDIYTNLGGNAEEFDTAKFNYYLKWAKLISQEEAFVSNGSLCGITSASDYSCNIENDAEIFNNMLMSGTISIDIVNMNYSTGVLTDTITSAASDSNIAYTNKSSIDSRELKKAEAEYENAMKQLSRQDKKYDLELNRLETERSALTTEYDSVKKVISENIERTFGIFS